MKRFLLVCLFLLPLLQPTLFAASLGKSAIGVERFLDGDLSGSLSSNVQRDSLVSEWSSDPSDRMTFTYSPAFNSENSIYSSRSLAFPIQSKTHLHAEMGQRVSVGYGWLSQLFIAQLIAVYNDPNLYQVQHNPGTYQFGDSEYTGAPVVLFRRESLFEGGLSVGIHQEQKISSIRWEIVLNMLAGRTSHKLVSVSGVNVSAADLELCRPLVEAPFRSGHYLAARVMFFF